MPVAIQEIHIQNLGPHTHFSTELGKFNLIFGHNEKGKTYLVEFIIRSIFRHANQWNLRTQKGKGKVVLSGLSNGKAVEFSPDSSKKLEDYWDEAKTGLPADFSRLLVVKGAEVEIVDVAGGVDKNILKRLLSGKNVLETVQKRISKTIQESQIENSVINGPKRGELSAKTKLEENLISLSKLFEQIDRGYSGGKRNMLLDQKRKIEDKIAAMIKAKQYLAYTVDHEVKRLRQEIARIPAETIQEVRSQLTLHRQKDLEYKNKQETQRAAEERSEQYEWLKNARDIYQDSLQKVASKPKPYFLILAVLSVLSGGALTFFELPIYAAFSLMGVLVFGSLHFKNYQNLLNTAVENQELQNIKNSFAEKFERKLTELPLILALLQQMEKDYNNARLLKKQLADDLNQLHVLKLSLSDQIYTLMGERKAPGTWDELLRVSQNNIKKLEGRLREKEIYFATLTVDPSDYQNQSPNVVYSKQQLDELQQQLSEIESQIEEESNKLVSLKQLICQQTGDDIATDWEEVIGNLRQKREELVKEYKIKTAEIIGKLAVHEVIKVLRKGEDSKLLAGLKSKEVQEPLFQLTNRYKNINLEEEKLVVSDQFHDFQISELSTGAQEQILLALRIGFATKIAGRDSLFLILDDAFQYSDWQRRQRLMEKVVQLTKEGWQIIYFTMDDHIRRLFDEAGKQFGEQYKCIELNAE
ncbi:MAG: hypothetical protein E2O77_07250 [Caldithrix sp.]|nr:MAG: hypothetical protein E2O77_07250 [Caldithrix sp.]